MARAAQPQPDRSGDPLAAAQGFGRVSRDPVAAFDPQRDIDAACAFFARYGFVVLTGCLDAAELAHLNEFCGRTQAERPEAWGLTDKRKPHHRNQGLILSQPLLDYPELDTTPPALDFRWWPDCWAAKTASASRSSTFAKRPQGAGAGAMNFHHDAVREDRLTRTPYMPCDWLCAIHYLTDVAPGAPCFCVVPGSNRFETLQAAFAGLGDSYREQPIHGPAGTCVLYDTATFHTRLAATAPAGARTLALFFHAPAAGWLRSARPATSRYIRSPSPALADWNLIPERLALHPDPATRLYFSHWNTAQGEWAASGFDPEVRKAMPRGEQG